MQLQLIIFHYGVLDMASRAQDIVDILLETDGTPNKGWQTPPNIPHVVVEDRDNPLGGFFSNPGTNGTIVVKKDYEDDYEKRASDHENKVWTFDLVIIATTDANLELMIRQVKEVFDRYESAPFATDTNSNTYDWARLLNGKAVEVLSSWAYDAKIQLTNIVSNVVIA